MTVKLDIPALVERLCAATGPDRELDAEIARTHVFDFPKGTSRIVPHYTASIDAAMTLVPEHWSTSTIVNPRDIGNFARVYNDGMVGDPAFPVHGNRPIAIAICIAALKARASLRARESA